jgi:DNA-binding GntR family transcriptional regulator
VKFRKLVFDVAMRDEPRTRVETIYRQLRTEILSGRHEPGARLLAAALCERYGISSGVLREVLPRLSGEGLVVSEPNRGFRVADVSVDDLGQLTEARVLIESATLRQAIAHGDVKFQADLVAAHHTLASTEPLDAAGSVRDDWLNAHATFHRALLAGSPNLRLRTIADSLRDATEVYRCWSRQLGDETDRDVAGEHRRILDATLARQADRAVLELTEHIERTTRVLLRARASVEGAIAR